MIVDYEKHKNEIHHIRKIVFIDEQGVSEDLEIDGQDENCYHVLAYNENNVPVGTGRMQKNGHIGRIAVLKEWRRQGFGWLILDKLTMYAKQRKLDNVFLNAQTHALSFYEKAGFIEEGDIFYEANIPHLKMVKSLSK